MEAVGSLLTSFTVGELSLTKQSHQVLSYRDYYAYGWALPGRQYEAQSDGNQFQYQGDFAVFNDLMNWNRFQLRNLDTRIGRWLSIDPAGQYYSLYKAMGNNPISVFDPDGAWGYTDEDGNSVIMKHVNYNGLTGVLIEAIKELSAENTALKNLIKNSSSFATLKSSL